MAAGPSYAPVRSIVGERSCLALCQVGWYLTGMWKWRYERGNEY